MPMVPGTISTTVTPRRVCYSEFGAETDFSIVLQSDNTDSTNTPTWRFREGNVVAKRTSNGQYVEANDTNAALGTQASITTSSHTDGNGVIKLVGSHGTISVTTTTGTGTEANNATDLNADQEFSASYIASSGAGELTIKSLAAGAHEWFYIHTDTMATASFSEGIGNGVAGTDADFAVTLQSADLQDQNGSAVAAVVRARRKGEFDESNLINLTDEAKAVFLQRGSIFR